MKAFLTKEVLAHPVVLLSCVASFAVAGGSVYYYQRSTALPQVALVHATQSAPQSAAIMAEGTVLPSQNPDLYFETSGRVARVLVAVGDPVSSGEVLATLDTAALSAARDQAAANLRLAQAKLDALKAGPRAVDVSAKQTAAAQAQQSESNLYAQAQNDINAAYSNSLGAVHAYSDPLYNSPNFDPSLIFTTNDSQLGIDANASRGTVNDLLSVWQSALANLSPDPTTLDRALADAIDRLGQLRAYANLLTRAVGVATINTTFTSASLATAQTNLALLRASISGSLSSLEADQQQLAVQKLAVQSAQNALAQLTAPATAQDLEAAGAAVDAAQASLGQAQAALGNATITAPFTGTVSAVRVKVGDLASAGLAALSLSPTSALQVDGYLSEADAAAVAPGDAAVVTLDTYGSARPFAATVASVDRAPTTQQGVPAYKVVLQFNQNDPALAAGMTANISITPHQYGQ